MHIMNNYNALYPVITLYNALYTKAFSKVLRLFYSASHQHFSFSSSLIWGTKITKIK